MSDADRPPFPSTPRPLPPTRPTVWWVLLVAAIVAAVGLFWRAEHRSAPAEHNTVELSRSPI